jgi:hypothetical protein
MVSDRPRPRRIPSAVQAHSDHEGKGFSVLICIVVSLLPLALYLFWLAGLNRRDRPVMIDGVWEAIALLFALSGFLLYAGPRLLEVLYECEVSSISLEEESQGPFEDAYFRWSVIWVVYHVAVVALGFLLVLSRRGRRGIYNVDLEQFRHALSHTLEELGLAMRHQGNTVYLLDGRAAQADGPQPAIAAAPASTAIQVEEPRPLEAPRVEAASDLPAGELRLEVFPALCHVTLHWRGGDRALQTGVEKALLKNLEYAVAMENPAAGWFLGISSLLFGALFMMAAMWIFTLVFPRRGL